MNSKFYLHFLSLIAKYLDNFYIATQVIQVISGTHMMIVTVKIRVCESGDTGVGIQMDQGEML